MKDTFYFPHDYDPANDPKIICLLGIYGGLGYGIFWRIIEMLHQEETHKLPMEDYIYTAIAKQMITDNNTVITLLNDAITKFKLFQSDNKFFWSNRVNKNILDREEKRQKKANAGKKGMKIRWGKHNTVITNITKERKGKESKVKKNSKEDIELATLLLTLIKNNTPTFKEPNITSWAKEIEKMRRIDKRTPEQIKYLIEWCQKDHFWQANILSTRKLREKFDILVAQIKRAKQSNLVIAE